MIIGYSTEDWTITALDSSAFKRYKECLTTYARKHIDFLQRFYDRHCSKLPPQAMQAAMAGFLSKPGWDEPTDEDIGRVETELDMVRVLVALMIRNHPGFTNNHEWATKIYEAVTEDNHKAVYQQIRPYVLPKKVTIQDAARMIEAARQQVASPPPPPQPELR